MWIIDYGIFSLDFDYSYRTGINEPSTAVQN